MKFTLRRFFDFAVAAILIVGVAFTVTFYGCGGKDDSSAGDTGNVAVPDQGEQVPAGPPTQQPDEGADNDVQQPPQVAPPQVVLPQKQRDVLIKSTTDGLNVRAGKSTSYKSIGSLDKGDMLAYTELSGGWYKVAFLNGYGYVSAAYVTPFEFDKADDKTEKVISEGKKLMGTPYVFGAQRYHWGNGVKNTAFTVNEFDCSSLMQYIFKLGANINLDTTSRSQSVQGSAVSKNNLKRGDLMFFTNDSRKNNTGIERIGHVGLYLGDNYILHTASDHAVIEEISAKRWSYYITARRMF